MVRFLAGGLLIGVVLIVTLLHLILKNREYIRRFWLYVRSKVWLKHHGDGAAVDKKALVRASKHTDKCYDNLVGQARMDRSVDYIKLNKQSALYDLVSQTADAGMSVAKDVPDFSSNFKPQVHISPTGEYTHFPEDAVNEETLYSLITEARHDIIIKFKRTLNPYGIRDIKQERSLYDIPESDFIATDEPVLSSCLLDYSILSIRSKTTSAHMDVCEFIIPVWHKDELPDFYSMLLVHEMIREMCRDKNANHLKILLICSKSRYVATVTVFECMMKTDEDTKLDPISVIQQLKINPLFDLNVADYKWISQVLKMTEFGWIERQSLESFITKYGAGSLPPEYFSSMIERLRLLVPDLDMSLCTSGIRDENRDCNRACDILPLDEERPYLFYASPLEKDYVNATYIKGHYSPSQFVVAEWPLKHTIKTFWRMIIDMRFDVVIVIGAPGHFSKWEFHYPEFYPACKESSASYNTLTVYNKDVKTKKHYSINKLNIKDTRVSQNTSLELDFTLLHLPQWPANPEEATEETLTALLKLIQKGRKLSKSCLSSSACVVSHDGASQCGVIIALWSILDQLESVDGEFDLFNTIRMIKLNRPHLIADTGEINLIYKLIHHLNKTGTEELESTESQQSENDGDSRSFEVTLAGTEFETDKADHPATLHSSDTKLHDDKQVTNMQAHTSTALNSTELDCRPKVYPARVIDRAETDSILSYEAI